MASRTVNDEQEKSSPGVAAALAVLAAADAACCAALGKRSRGQDHRQAVLLVKTIFPFGTEMARALSELLAAKDDVHYGSSLVSANKAERMVRQATILLEFFVDRYTDDPLRGNCIQRPPS